jgi:hypothetical protein
LKRTQTDKPLFEIERNRQSDRYWEINCKWNGVNHQSIGSFLSRANALLAIPIARAVVEGLPVAFFSVEDWRQQLEVQLDNGGFLSDNEEELIQGIFMENEPGEVALGGQVQTKGRYTDWMAQRITEKRIDGSWTRLPKTTKGKLVTEEELRSSGYLPLLTGLVEGIDTHHRIESTLSSADSLTAKQQIEFNRNHDN